MQKAEEALERSERTGVASRYASAIMHEVNNPLEAITNLVYLAKEQRDEPDIVLEYMLQVEEQLAVLAQVTRQSLAFHRHHSEAKPLDLVTVAEAALKLHLDKCLRHGVDLDRKLEGPAIVTVSGSELLQVTSNLLLNAIEAFEGHKGSVTVSVRSSVSTVSLSVSDNGPGIAEDVADRLFEPYSTTKKNGTGLGLWISRRIIEKYGGKLRFRTSRRKGQSGTTFRISFPALVAASL